MYMIHLLRERSGCGIDMNDIRKSMDCLLAANLFDIDLIAHIRQSQLKWFRLCGFQYHEKMIVKVMEQSCKMDKRQRLYLTNNLFGRVIRASSVLSK